MRPVRLELHGFTAFREPVTVDFDGADLFALTGATGAGKSSLIDAMCFALYGSVPRLDRRTVAPVVSTGRTEARIRFDFTVGERAFTAVRVVRRTATGATTKEARLERDGETLAGDADGMTAAVESLLGLGFEQFTKCVVLPQGDFARFLHDKPSARQELLVKLLELGVYEQMRMEAGNRKSAADATVELLTRELEGLADATPEALAEAQERVVRLLALRDEIDAAQPQLDALAQRAEAARREVEQAHAHAAALRDVVAPADVQALASAMGAARRNLATASDLLADAESAVTAAEKHRGELPDAGGLTAAARDHERLVELTRRVARGVEVVAARRQTEATAARLVAAAQERVQAATAALDAARHDHAAADVAATLVAGQPCPVCLQDVAVLPKRPPAPALDDAQRALRKATEDRDEKVRTLQPLSDARINAEQHLEVLREEAAAVADRLRDAPPAERIAASLAAIAEADATLTAAREQERVRRAAVRAAQADVDGLDKRMAQGWRQFDAARDSVATLAPPAIPREDLAAAWSELSAWAATTATTVNHSVETAVAAAAQATQERDALTAQIAARCQECAVELRDGGRPRDAAGDALAKAEAARQSVATALDRAARLREELAAQTERAAVAKALGTHLSSRGFEQWLLDEALDRLAAGASEVLRELSGGQYSLSLDAQRNFSVVDHRNADEQRPARTLSGGETFLASLSLALTLADHLAALSVDAEPRLESMFLDEGFGTLDPETLDVVAAAIEELGAGGRTIGIVTHVRDLAERMPVRFEVSKTPTGSVVERIER